MKFDQQRDRVIAERRAAGETLQQLATDFGVSRERIRQIVQRFKDTVEQGASPARGRRPPR